MAFWSSQTATKNDHWWFFDSHLVCTCCNSTISSRNIARKISAHAMAIAATFGVNYWRYYVYIDWYVDALKIQLEIK